MYLLDSNIVIDFLNGDKKVGEWIGREKSSSAFFPLAISVVSKIEVLSGRDIKENQVEELEKFLDVFDSFAISNEIVRLAATLRREKILSLGDAIVAATAIVKKCSLVTRDKSLAKNVKDFVEVVSI